jgi:hypothetical protein
VSQWLESCAEYIPRAINATEGGRSLAGWGDVPLDDVLSGLPLCGLTPGHLIAAAPPVINGPARIDEWLRNHATDQLLDAYAMRAVVELMDPWRNRKPSRLRWAEHIRATLLLGDLEKTVAAKRAELEALCMEVSNG